MSFATGDLFMTVSNKHCRQLYPDNNSSHYKIHLDEYTDFSDNYSTCALVDIAFTTRDVDLESRNIYVTLNVVAEQVVGTRKESLLRYTTVRRNRAQMEKFSYPYYIPLKPMRGNYLEIYIKDDLGHPVSFLKSTTTCTLHFRQ